MRTGAFIVARLSSSRLPRKALLDIAGKPMIEHIVERVRRARTIDTVVITTSEESSDDDLEAQAARIGVPCYRGPLANIMERVRAAAAFHRCGTVVEILGDNPLVHSDLIDEVVSLHRTGSNDYSANITREYAAHVAGRALFSVGIRVQAYSLSVAERHGDFPEYLGAAKDSTAYIYEHPETFRLGFLEAKGRWSPLNRPEINFAVNYRKNFEGVAQIFSRLYPHAPDFSLQEAMAVYNQDDSLHAPFGQ